MYWLLLATGPGGGNNDELETNPHKGIHLEGIRDRSSDSSSDEYDEVQVEGGIERDLHWNVKFLK